MRQAPKFAAVLSALLLTGCPVKPSGTYYKDAPKPTLNANQGALYVMHEGSATGTSKIGFEVNGQALVSLTDGEYTWVELPPGSYEVTNRTPFMQIDLSGRTPSASTHTVEIKAGKKSYYIFSITLKSMEAGMGVSYAAGVPIGYMEPVASYRRNFDKVTVEEFAKNVPLTLYNPSIKYSPRRAQ